MVAETITVYIDPEQLVAQKDNNYSLYLAKKVNGQFTVIWQAMRPMPTAGQPSYEYRNVFQIATPDYQVNYGAVTTHEGWVAFQASGLSQAIEVGQTVTLDPYGLFGAPTSNDAPGEITILNQLQGNPVAALNDSAGNLIFINVQSGMDIGEMALIPVDAYQLWFDNFQDTGTIIAQNVSNVGAVYFDGGEVDQVISYNAEGQWRAGPPPARALAADAAVSGQALMENPNAITVVVTFQSPLTSAMVTYLLTWLITDFSPSLRPTSLTASVGGSQLLATFLRGEGLQPAGGDPYEAAVNAALMHARYRSGSGLENQHWTLGEPS